jgi:TetR/AcrR family transcriptional regulator, transcriptional repressor for nem operon
MGRNRAYDEDAVLGGAMQAFRRMGYQAASIRDLESATGLKAGSIYNSFGDKAGLFDAAFAHYNRAVLGGRIERHAPPEAGIDGLRRLFLSLLDEPGGTAFGCLITNTAVEGGGSAAPHPGVAAGLGTLARTFAERLAAARDTHRLCPGVVPDIAASKLLALYQGILLLIRAGHDRAGLERLIDDEFDNLETTHDA